MRSRSLVPLLTLALVATAWPLGAGDVSAGLTPDDPRFPDQTNLAQVRAPLAWDATLGGPGSRVCVVDTGLRGSHEEFAGRVVAWVDLIGNEPQAFDDHGHGTMLAGVATARIGNARGIAGAGNVDIMAAKVLTSSGSGAWTTYAQGIQWCADTGGARTVILLASGSASPNDAVEAAVQHATAQGALVVASVGSSGSIAFPARLPQVLAVGCSTATEARCSSTGSGPELDVLSPGTRVWTTSHEADDAYRMINGSSFASALVAGAVALAWTQHPGLTPAQMHARVLATAQDLGPPGQDDGHGCGELDLAALLTAPAGGTCGMPILSAPRDLTAGPGPGAGEIRVSWAPPASDGGSAVLSYRVHRAATCTAPFTPVATTTATEHVDAGLGDGATRCYQVTASNAAGESAPSLPAQATTYAIPLAPTFLRAEPGDEVGMVRVRWGIATEGSPVTAFVVERAAGSGAFVEAARTGRVGGYDDRALDLAGWYSYQVRAANPAGVSEPSTMACTRPGPWSDDARLNELECVIARAWPAAPDAP